MIFARSDEIYKVSRITGTQDNILGISLADCQEDQIDLVEWPIKQGEKRRAAADQVLEQVLLGLTSINRELGTNYWLSKVYFLPSDSHSNSVYEFLIRELIKKINVGGEFVEV